MEDILKNEKIRELIELLKEASEADLKLLIYHAIKEILRREQDNASQESRLAGKPGHDIDTNKK